MHSKKKYSTMSNTIYALSWYFRVAPGYMIFSFLILLFGEFVTLFEHTFLIAHIITCVEEQRTLTDVLGFVIPVIAAVLLKVLLESITNSYITPRQNAKLQKSIQLSLFQKAMSLDISNYDNPEFYNDYIWLQAKISKKF